MSYYIILCGKSQVYVNEKLLDLNIILILRTIYLFINKHFAALFFKEKIIFSFLPYHPTQLPLPATPPPQLPQPQTQLPHSRPLQDGPANVCVRVKHLTTCGRCQAFRWAETVSRIWRVLKLC